MAGETRRQRRDARRAAGAAETTATRSRFVRQPVDAGDSTGAVVAPAPSRELAQPRRGLVFGTFGFIGESWAELKKVDWPTRPQVVQGTIVVLVACLIIGVYLYGADRAIQPFVRDVLLRNK
jgi:preprotein translocase subunit SecE